MNTPEDRDILDELKTFYEELKSYKKLLNVKGRLSARDSLREKLVRQSGALKGKIIELTGRQYAGSRLRETFDIWTEAFNTIAMSEDRTALAFCINATNEAIGKLESDINEGVRDKQGKIIEKPPKDTAELPVNLFDKMQFHPRVIEVSESLFKTRNYASAILEAFKAVDNYVKEKTTLSLNGQALMSKVFDENAPIIKLNDLLTQSDRDEQEGFKFLFKGATIGIRNPKAHDNVVQTDPYRTLEYLGLASLLMRRIEEGKLVKLLKQRSKT